MTENEAAILAVMAADPPGKRFRLRQLGGHRNSHHGVTVPRMVRKGWIERHEIAPLLSRIKGQRRTVRYWITHAGRQALANHRLGQRGAQALAQAIEGDAR